MAEWISVKDKLPETSKRVLVACEVRFIGGGSRTYECVAFYAAHYTVPLGNSLDDYDCYDYNEEADEYFLKEGWYEVINNWDEYSSVVIADFVTHWMPLPEPPKEET